MNGDGGDDGESDAGSGPVHAEEEGHDWRQMDSVVEHRNDDSSTEQLDEERDVPETQPTSVTSSEAG